MSSTIPATLDAVTTLGDLARFHGAGRPDVEALWFEGRSTSYRDFDQLTNRVANGLLAEGVEPGSRVGFMDKNSDHFYQLVFGCAKANAVSVGINWRLAPPEVAYILNDSRAEVLFVGPDFYPLVERIRAEVPTLRRIVAMEAGQPEWTPFTAWRDGQPAHDPGVAVTTDDVAIQMYTSGTTGHPKGVQLPHRCFFDLWRYPPAPDMAFNEWTESDVNLVAMPSFHIGGVGWGIMGIRPGARNVIVREFEPGSTLEMIQRFRISKLFLVPAAIRMVLQHPQARTTDYGSVKYIHYGASPIPLDLLREALEVFQCGFVQLYGMTETTGSATYLPPEDHDPRGNERMRSAGKPFPGVRLKVVDEAGRPLPARQVGEICIASPVNMLGYWNLPEATATTLIDGYVHTGDAGFLDEDGYVYVHDRVKDMIVSGAENIYPAEVESALFGHPAVADVAVFGVPDERWGEAVKAAVVLKPGARVSADELIGFARGRIAGYKLPKSIDFIAELPRNPSGKILKRELRKPYWEGMSRNVN
ncbi:MAG: fatty acid--CoA ligase [Pseudomonadales bacterium]|nr:fatty acid--CoA ligase [Pseudomonadales bacterium]